MSLLVFSSLVLNLLFHNIESLKISKRLDTLMHHSVLLTLLRYGLYKVTLQYVQKNTSIYGSAKRTTYNFQ